MWWWMLLIGFVIANVPSMFYQVFNGFSLFGLIIVLFAGMQIVVKETSRGV